MIKLVVFDLWQTLAFRDVKYWDISRMLEETGVQMPEDKFVKVFENSLQRKKWKSKILAYKSLAENMGLPATRVNAKKLMQIRDVAERKTKLFPHSLALLKQLRKQGFKTGLLSNSSVFAARQLKKRTKLLEFIDFPLFSFDVGVIKPSPEFFQAMLKISRTKPAEVLMIGDKPGDDVFPARKLGINAIHFKDFESLKEELAGFGIIVK